MSKLVLTFILICVTIGSIKCYINNELVNGITNDQYNTYHITRLNVFNVKNWFSWYIFNIINNWIYPSPQPNVSVDGKTWQNWGNTVRCNSSRIYSDSNGSYRSLNMIEQIQNAIKTARKNNEIPIRVFGTSHSYAGLIQSTGTLIDCKKFGWKLNNPIDSNVFNQETAEKWIDPKYLFVTPNDKLAKNSPTVTFPAGISTGVLERWIYYSAQDKSGNKLNQRYSIGTSTYEDIFTMSGIIATSSHGTGKIYPPLSDWVVSITFIDSESIIRKIQVDGKSFYKLTEEEEWKIWDTKNISGNDLFRSAQANYGLFGIMWSITMKIIPGFNTLFIAENISWELLFDNSEISHNNLFKLQDESESLAFFYYPYTTKNSFFGFLSWQKNPYLYTIRHLVDTPENRKLLEAQGYNIVTKNTNYYLFRDANTKLFSNFYHKLITFIYNLPKNISGKILPYILAHVPNNLEYTVTLNKKEALSLPNWRALHPFNAVGSVEKVKALNIEWNVPITFNNQSNGFKYAIHIYNYIIKSIHKAIDNNNVPISLVAETRYFQTSNAYFSPYFKNSYVDYFQNDEPTYKYNGWSSCGIISINNNPWWVDFSTQLNYDIYDLLKNKVTVRNHLAKQYGRIPNQFERLRYELDKEDIHPFSIFCKIRNFIDPHNVFLTPFMEQFLITNKSHYTPPIGYPNYEDGSFLSIS